MKKDKRKMILDAASNCFARYGYKKTTLDDISKIVGFRKAASIDYYFENKTEIYITLVPNDYRSLIPKLYEENDEELKCEEKILIYFDKRLE